MFALAPKVCLADIYLAHVKVVTSNFSPKRSLRGISRWVVSKTKQHILAKTHPRKKCTYGLGLQIYCFKLQVALIVCASSFFPVLNEELNHEPVQIEASLLFCSEHNFVLSFSFSSHNTKKTLMFFTTCASLSKNEAFNEQQQKLSRYQCLKTLFATATALAD